MNLYLLFNSVMDIKITQHNGINIAEVISDKIILREVQDAVNLMADCTYQDSGRSESNKHGRIIFAENNQDAIERLSRH